MENQMNQFNLWHSELAVNDYLKKHTHSSHHLPHRVLGGGTSRLLFIRKRDRGHSRQHCNPLPNSTKVGKSTAQKINNFEKNKHIK